ncbi:hypothetical protein HBI34_000730 [Parastagonospora nodorum]|nr:hypothetical protein HBI34_000730 [Parastagonospora nodorum]KAH6412878.1 hypothetical protein HBI14_134060 [Parastagonospora nodorum]
MSSRTPDLISNQPAPFATGTKARPRTPKPYTLPSKTSADKTASDTPNSDNPRQARPGQKRKHYTSDGDYCDDPWPRKMRKIRPAEEGEYPGFIEMSVVDSSLASAVGTNLETSPSNPVTSQCQLPTPAPSPESFLPPPQCHHPRHPAHSALRNELTCPMCSLNHLVSELHRVERRMLKQPTASKWRFLLLGSDASKPRRKILDAYGNDFSHRHCRLRLSNLQIKLEDLALKETGFENLFLLDHPELTTNSQAGELFDDTYGTLYKYTAKYALAYYNASEARGDFTRTPDDDAKYVRERGREQEIAKQEGYPEDPDDKARTHIRTCTTEAQQAYVDNSTVPPISDDTIASPPKRQCRNAKAKVSFNSDAQVCIENDVDRLRKQAFNSTCTSTPIGIVRTAASPSEADASLGSRFNTDPRRRFYTIPTNQTNDGRHMYSYNRRSSSYESGQWATSPGSPAVDTSGYRMCKKDPKIWDRYCKSLQYQAATWDRSDKMNVGI